MKIFRSVSFSLALFSPLLLESATWNLNADGNWNVNGNWITPAIFPNAIGATGAFGNIITAPHTVTLGQNITVGTMTFANAGGNSYQISGANNLILDVAAGNAAITSSTGAHTISSALILNDPLLLTQNSTGTFTISGPISGVGTLTKAGARTLSLTNAANSQAGTIINVGILSIPNDGSLGLAAAPLTFTGTSTLAPTVSFATNRSIILGPLGTTATIAPPVGITFTANGPISGNGNLSILNGELVLTNNLNSYSGSTIFGSGAILQISSASQLGNTSMLNITAGGAAMLNTTQNMTLSMPMNFTAGGGGLRMDVDAGTTLIYAGDISSSVGVTGALSVRGGSGTLRLLGNNTGYSNGLLIGDPTGLTRPTVQVMSDMNLGNASSLVRLQGGILQFLGNVIAPATRVFNIGNVVPDQPLFIADAGTVSEINGIVQRIMPSSSTPAFNLQGPGTLALKNPANTFQWGVSVTGNGTLQALSNGSLGLDVVGNFVQLDGGALEILQAGGGIASANRPLQLNGASGGTILLDDGTASSWGGPIQGNQNLTLAKPTLGIGTGTIAFSGDNSASFTGDIFVNDVTLQISDANTLGSGASLTLNQGKLEFLNAVTIPSSKNIQLIGSGTFIADNGESHLSGVVSGGGNFIKQGPGTLFLDAVNSYNGNTSIAQGTLVVDGDISSSPLTTVGAGTVLAGTGFLNQVDVFGTVSPGYFSIGTLTGTQFTFEPGSVYDVEVIGHLADKIVATNTINILPGSTLMVMPQNIQQEFFTIATAAGGVTGTFSNIVSPLPRFFFVRYDDPDAVILQFTGFVDFSDFFRKGNLKNIAVCFDSMIHATSSETPMTELLHTSTIPGINRILEVLDSLSASEIHNAFNQFDPSLYGAINLSELDASEGILEFYRNHLSQYRFTRTCGCAPYALWVAPLGLHEVRNSAGHLRADSGYRNWMYGVATGLDVQVTDNLLTSAGFAYTNSHMKWKQAPAHANYDSYSAIVGAAYENNCFFFEAGLAGTYHAVHAERKVFIAPSPLVPIPVAPLDYTIRNHNDAFSLATNLSAACNVYTCPDYQGMTFSIWPYVNLDYLYVHQFPFLEKGGTALDMNIYARDADLLVPEGGLGISMTKNFCDCQYILFGEASLGYSHEYRFQGRSMTASFRANPGCKIELTGLYPQNGLFVPRIDIGLENCGLSYMLSYKGFIGDAYTSTEVALEFRLNF